MCLGGYHLCVLCLSAIASATADELCGYYISVFISVLVPLWLLSKLIKTVSKLAKTRRFLAKTIQK
jgi:hypothetical protein